MDTLKNQLAVTWEHSIVNNFMDILAFSNYFCTISFYTPESHVNGSLKSLLMTYKWFYFAYMCFKQGSRQPETCISRDTKNLGKYRNIIKLFRT